MMEPAIVVVAYNREESLKRLLQSLSNASYPKRDISLVISIDRSENDKVREAAEKFVWKFGKKEVILHKERMGLRKHILSCGDLTKLYGSIILLEDDLFVSPYFYQYSIEALLFYEADDRIAGISLYNYKINEYVGRSFEPIHDGADVYFVQTASSWGQAWTNNQWNGFRKWYDSGDRTLSEKDNIPLKVVKWPESSWKKYFIKYLVEKDKYFVYPRISLTTNCGDVGEHTRGSTPRVHVPLLNGEKVFNMCTLKDSRSVYDAFYEIKPFILNIYNRDISTYDYEVDLYKSKFLDNIEKKYLLTKYKCNNSIKSYSRFFIPPEMAILHSVQGIGISLCKKSDIITKEDKDEVYYNYPSVTFRDALKIIKYKLRKKLLKR